MPASNNDDLLLLVGRIDGKLDTLLHTSSTHETRIALLEAWRNRLAGAVAVLSSAVAADHLPAGVVKALLGVLGGGAQ